MPHRLTNLPSPDPTILTTQALQREIEALKERFNDKSDLVRQVAEERMECLEHEIKLLRDIVESAPARRDQALNQMQELIDEKFHAINARFAERDIRATAMHQANKEAINAALTTVKETMNKSELAFTKQVDQIMTLIYSAQKGSDGKIDDLKERLTILESHKLGAKEEATTYKQAARDNTATWAFAIAAVAAGIAVLNYIARITGA